ncbi:TIGR03086 family protein [Hoyosella rhizosphaerae]|uniref:Mycothiol-dependent maleylpyruvate isomerase metal-binding domain-containing protein n=1 Tax=Hoyosella rhizosphaerae TaxID=1755582 RepID=A0A916U8F7_9ACTN|nr:TIGR03086 family metal-binding protein [Hoyosella rhizosphaerae]MBN4927541.1 TIGR03086 family protein [Hoyosella rhizosphaerae]GGC63675.1 hypothetical protein GCM10011410_15140 [Hoyosella rhizosphaerae]
MRYDLTPAAQEITRLLDGIASDDLERPTPCTEYTVATLLNHVKGLAYAFHLAAPVTPKDAHAHELLKNPPSPTADELDANWRETIPQHLRTLAETWRNPDAWDGEATVGGVTMPANITGLVALDELVLHGWDLARATGQEFHCDDASTSACLTFTLMSAAPGEEAGRKGLFGPVIDVPADAPPLDRAVGLSGRDPHWQP